MFCHSCGAKVPEGSSVCLQCGSAAQADPGLTRSVKKKKTAILVIALVFAAAVTAGVLYLHWYNSPEQKICRAFAEGDLLSVQQIYHEELEDTPSQVTDEVLSRLEELGTGYADGTLEYDAANADLVIFEEMQVTGTGKQLTGTRQLLDAVKASREAFVQGQSLEAGKAYPAAMESYALVIEADVFCFEQAQQKIRDCRDAYRRQILAEAAVYADSQLYADAIGKLQEGLTVLPEDASLLGQIQSYEEASAEKERYDLLEKAADYVARGDYPNAIRTLEGREDDAQIDAMYQTYRQEYASSTITQAKRVFAEDGYEAALALINTCLQTLPENAELLAEKAFYESYAPVYLASCDIYSHTGNKLYQNEHTQDQQENTYTSSFAAKQGSVNFLVDGKYALFTGTVACPYGYAYDKYRSGAKILVYADDVLIYQSELVELDTAPQSFALDITGVEIITIEWISEGSNIWKNWGDRATVFDGAFYQHG